MEPAWWPVSAPTAIPLLTGMASPLAPAPVAFSLLFLTSLAFLRQSRSKWPAVDGHRDDDDEADDQDKEGDEVGGQVGGRVVAARPGSGRVSLRQVLHVDVVALGHDLVRGVGAVVDAVASLVQVDALAGNGALEKVEF